MPLLSLFMNPVTAAATLPPVCVVTDCIGVWLYRSSSSRRNVRILVPAILFGVAIAAVIPPCAPKSALLLFICGIGLWSCARVWLARGATGQTTTRLLPGLFRGTITGIACFITHSGAPPSQAYLLPQRLPKLEFVGTVSISFAVGNLVKIPACRSIGQLDGLHRQLIGGLALAGIAGTFAGRWPTGRLPEALCVRRIRTLRLALSGRLLVKGGLQLLG